MEKKTKKTVKPAFKVDLTKAEDSADVMLAFAKARFDARVPLEQRDIDIIMVAGALEALDAVDDAFDAIAAGMCVISELCYKCSKKKQPWYKRFWNWLTGKNK